MSGLVDVETVKLASPSPSAILKAIQDCGAEMVSIRDRELVLQAVVCRARHLLGSDLAYISLNDLVAGETYLHVTDGVRTEAFRTIRMPLGTGILGVIAAGKSAAYTAVYTKDRNLTHVPEIDRIVAGEGVRTVTGVPIQIRGRVVGALLIAHRMRATLSSRGLYALEQLAVQAALVLDQITRSNELDQLRNEMGMRGEWSDNRLRELERLLELDDTLMGGLINATDPGGVLDILSDVLNYPASLYSPSGELVMGEPTLPRDMTVAQRQRFDRVVDASLAIADPAVLQLETGEFVVMSIAVGKQHLGSLVVSKVADAQPVLLRRAASFVGTAMLIERTLIDADQRANSQLIEDLLMAEPGKRSSGLMRRLATHGISAQTTVTSICVLAHDGEMMRIPDVVRTALCGLRAIISPHAGHVCALVPSANARELGQEVRSGLQRANIRAAVGVASDAGQVPSCLQKVHEESVDVAQAALALGSFHEVHDVTSLGVAGLLLSGADPGVADHVIERFIGPLLAYDDHRGTQLGLTAWHYLAQQGRLGPTATALHIHPNTVKQRLDRIDMLLGVEWRRPGSVVDTQFALRLWQLRQQNHS